jgi:hypothetical protein
MEWRGRELIKEVLVLILSHGKTAVPSAGLFMFPKENSRMS